VNTNELILEMLHNLDVKIIQMDKKLDNLPCAAQNIRIDRLEQKELGRKESKATMWSIALAAVGAFGLSLWTWLKGT